MNAPVYVMPPALMVHGQPVEPTGEVAELLRQLIVASDQTRQEFVMWYLKSAFDTYQAVQDAVKDRFSDVQSALLSPVDSMKRFLSGQPSPPQPDRSELQMLRERLAELEGHRRNPTKSKRGTLRKAKRRTKAKRS